MSTCWPELGSRPMRVGYVLNVRYQAGRAWPSGHQAALSRSHIRILFRTKTVSFYILGTTSGKSRLKGKFCEHGVDMITD